MPPFCPKSLPPVSFICQSVSSGRNTSAGKRRQGKFYRVLSSVEWYLFSFDLTHISCVRARRESLLSTCARLCSWDRSCIRSLTRGEVADKYNFPAVFGPRRNDTALTMNHAVYPFKARRVVVLFPRGGVFCKKVFMSLNHRKIRCGSPFRICQSRLVSWFHSRSCPNSPPHEEELFAGVPHHPPEEQPEVCGLLPVISGHFAPERSFLVDHLVMRERQDKVFGVCVPHTECKLVVVVLSEDGVFDIYWRYRSSSPCST